MLLQGRRINISHSNRFSKFTAFYQVKNLYRYISFRMKLKFIGFYIDKARARTIYTMLY